MVGRTAKMIMAVVVGAVMILTLVVGGMAVYNYMFVPVWTEQIPLLNATGHAVTITDYRNATNTTYANLTAFLESDRTEDALYVDPNYTCAEFAVRMHDNAEAHGIKNGIVNVQFEGQAVGHAFNVFPTDDRGLVYVDATGLNATQLQKNLTPAKAAVYLQNGSELGEISFNQTGDNISYAFYLDRKQKISLYKDELAKWEDDFTQYTADYDAWNESRLQNDQYYINYSKDATAYQQELEAYNTQMEAHNAAVRRYNAGDRSVYIPPVPTGADKLDAWRAGLNNEYLQYANRGNELKQQGNALMDRYNALMDRYDALMSREEAKWISYNPDGVVNYVAVYW